MTRAQIINAGIEEVPIDQLREHPRNPNRGQVDKLQASIRVNGFFGVVVAQRSTGFILAGNHRRRAALAEGLKVIPTAWVDCDDEVAMRIMLADNRIAEAAQRDPEALAELLSELAAGEGLEGTGYEQGDLEELLSELTPSVDLSPDQAPEPRISQAEQLQHKWQTAPGQLWSIGPHRLLCGDATEEAVAARLFGELRADCCWTDPPYGIEYEGKGRDRLTIQNDGAEGLYDLLVAAMAQVVRWCKPGSPVYVAHPSAIQALDFYLAWRDAGLRLHQGLVWVKNQLILGRTDYQPRHEPMLYGYTPSEPGSGRRGRFGGESGWFGDDAQTTVLEFDKPSRNDLHPTMKPPALVAYCLNNSCPRGGLVYEPFGGSGTTLVAAQMTHRACFSTELDPNYCAVILERLAEMGLEPKLLEEG